VLTKSLPKAMMPIEGKPFLEREIALLHSKGISDFVICIGYLGQVIEEHFGDGHRFGVSIMYVSDWPKMLGPAGALKKAAPLLADSFFVTYGDAYLRMNYVDMLRSLVESEALGVMAVYRNKNAHGRSDLEVENGRIVRYDKRGGEAMEWINYGVTALRKQALRLIPSKGPCDEEKFYGMLIARSKLLAYKVRNRFYEIGTPSSLEEFRMFIRTREHHL